MKKYRMEVEIIVYCDWCDVEDFEAEIEHFNSANKKLIEVSIENIEELEEEEEE